LWKWFWESCGWLPPLIERLRWTHTSEREPLRWLV
jgi:hypothetical protein